MSLQCVLCLLLPLSTTTVLLVFLLDVVDDSESESGFQSRLQVELELELQG